MQIASAEESRGPGQEGWPGKNPKPEGIEEEEDGKEDWEEEERRQLLVIT